MVNRILTAKHWQLFIVIAIIPMLFILLKEKSNSDLLSVTTFSYLSKFLRILNIAIFYSWIWAIVNGFQNRIPENLKLKMGTFKTLFFLSITYLIINILFLEKIITRIESTQKTFLLTLHLLSIFGMFYAVYFASKSLKTIELNKKIKLRNCIGDFFMLLFYPIGIWIIQPRINKLLEKKEQNNN